MPVYIYIPRCISYAGRSETEICFINITSQLCFSIHYAILGPRFESVTSITQNKRINRSMTTFDNVKN
jgi:hypothetical protein